MIRNLSIFLVTFLVGALIAFAGRAALHKPDVAATNHTGPAPMAMVGNALTPAAAKTSTAASHASHETAVKPTAPPTEHGSNHGAVSVTSSASDDQPVNTVCAICGMKVDPKVPTLEYQGKKIGFGCRMCPPKFLAEPDKYGPYYLRNEVIKR